MASEEAVRKQLAKILISEGFVHARRMRRFLAFIVEEALRGRGSELCEYTIGVSVFERDESFEPGLDPIVRNDARRLRQKLLEYYQKVCDAGDVLIEIPKGGYVPVFQPLPAIQQPSSRGKYRLTICLRRIADGAEIWSSEQEVDALQDVFGQ